MESSMEEIGKHCHMQLMFFTQCFEKNPNDWESVCAKEKAAVTKCAEENVTSLRLVKQRCASEITTYQTCLQENPTNPTACSGTLKQLYDCHNAVTQAQAADQSIGEKTQ
ncbi:hypothetical protein BC832DRAFT_528262 [Gaertneriomyces semiglobifer]|nr:hypothetical protein BC832DRAFT_528262 [Gaertneriomyces semiglobifer]